MKKVMKMKNGDLPTCDGVRCLLHVYANYPLPHRFSTVWPRFDRKSGFVVHRYDVDDYLESIKTNSYRRARVIAKRFVEGKA